MNGLKNVHTRRDDALTRVGWGRLETMLADHYRGQGWSVDHVGTGASRTRFDGGIDLKLRKDGEYVLVQCKHWNAKQVPHNAVNELLGLKTNENATGAIVITSGEFTQAAREAATRQGHVQLIDGDALRTMLGPQIETLAASLPPPLPAAPTHRRKHEEKSVGQRTVLLLAALLLSALVCYGVYRLLTWPMHHTVDVKLPQRTIPRPQQGKVRPNVAPQAPISETKVEARPKIEPAMTGAELEEWKKKNEEAMRILEDNDTESGSEK